MPCKYEVRVDGKAVWSEDRDGYEGRDAFPAEYLQRPTSGVVELVVDDEIIARQEPLDVDAFVDVIKQNITGTMNMTLDDTTAEVG